MPKATRERDLSDGEAEEPKVVMKMGNARTSPTLTVNKSARKYVRKIEFVSARDLPLRLVSPFDNVTKVLQYGLAIYSMDDDDEYEGALLRMPEKERERCLRIFKATLKLVPGLKKYILANLPASDDLQVFGFIAENSTNAKSDHTRSLRLAIPDYVLPGTQCLDPPVTDSSKADRGLKHAFLGRLFCPATRIADFEADPASVLEQLRSGAIPLSIDETKGRLYYGVFLYKDYTCDPANILSGLFESEILFRTYAHLNYGPSAAKNMHEKPLPELYKGTAKKNNRTTISGHDIGYSAIHALFAISGYGTWQQTIYGIDLKKFFGWIVDWLDDPEDAFAKQIRECWNVKVYGHKLGRGHEAENVDDVAAEPAVPDPLTLARQAFNTRAQLELEKTPTRTRTPDRRPTESPQQSPTSSHLSQRGSLGSTPPSPRTPRTSPYLEDKENEGTRRAAAREARKR